MASGAPGFVRLGNVGCLVAAAFVAACGGSDSSALFNAPGSGGAGNATSTGGATAGTGGAITGTGGGTTASSGGATASGGGTSTSSGGATSAGGTTSTADAGRASGGSSTSSDSGPPASGGATSGATPGTILCAGAPCYLNTSECCVGGIVPDGTCLPPFPGCVTAGVALNCDDASDCTAGQLCCGSVSKGSSCGATCPNGGDQLCRTNAECPKNRKCQPDGSNSAFGSCQ